MNEKAKISKQILIKTLNNYITFWPKNRMTNRTVLSVFLTLSLFHSSCSKFDRTQDEFIYNLIEHIEKAEIKATSFDIPKYTNLKLDSKINTWNTNKNNQVLPALSNKGKALNIEEGAIRTIIKFKDTKSTKYKKQITEINSYFGEKGLIKIENNSLKPFNGNWNIEKPYLANFPVDENFNLLTGYNVLIHNLMKVPTINSSKLPVIPENINVLLADIDITKDFEATAEIIFETKAPNKKLFADYKGRTYPVKINRCLSRG